MRNPYNRSGAKQRGHDYNQPVQFVPPIRDHLGNEKPGTTCRVEAVCIFDGTPAIFTDDGYGSEGDGEGDNQSRAQMKRSLRLRDDDKDPVFVTREPLKPWPYPTKDGTRWIQPPETVVIDERIAAKIERNKKLRAEFIAGAKARHVERKAPALPTDEVKREIKQKGSTP